VTSNETIYLPWDRYVETISADTDRLLEVAAPVLGAEVPSCPGWDVDDLLDHVGHVYLHKVAAMRSGESPDPWPPPDLDTTDPVRFVREAGEALLRELGQQDPYAEGWTWYDADQTNGFWFRRMAQEIAIHRVDGELAHGAATGEPSVTPIPEDIALDGIDEYLHLFVGGSWEGEDVGHPVDSTVRVASTGRAWTLQVSGERIDVTRTAEDEVPTEITGSAHDVYVWLWGRGPLDALSVFGDEDLAVELRARFAEA